MTALLHHTLYPIGAVSVTTSAAGYPAINVLTPAIRKPWRSTDATLQLFNIDLGAVRMSPILCLQGINAPSIALFYGAASYTTTNAGVHQLPMDRHGTRKWSFAIPASVRYIQVRFGASLPDNGAAMYEMGAVYVFALTLALPDDPLLGSDVTAALPQTRVELPNGNEFAIERGAPRQRLNFRFRTTRTLDIQEVIRRARASVCWFDMGLPASRELQWPVRHVEPTMQRQLSGATQDEATIELREQA